MTALFAFFNRVADAFGLDDPNDKTLSSRPPAWIIHGLLIEDAMCRDVTRSVSEGGL